MFHHFPDELDTPDYLVRSTEFTYNQSPIASFITQVTQSGYVRQPNGTYLKKSLPPLAFEYSQATVSEEIQVVDPESLENLPVGADGAALPVARPGWRRIARRLIRARRWLVLQAQPEPDFGRQGEWKRESCCPI